MERVRKFLYGVLAVLLIATGVFCTNTIIAYADEEAEESNTHEFNGRDEEYVLSIQKDMFTGTFKKKVSNGEDIFAILEGSEEDRRKLNYDIYTGAESEKHSLYDRFGGSLTIPMYTGETVITTGAADKLYTAIMQGMEKEFKFNEFLDLVMMSDTTYTNKYYKDRPILKSSDCDPRTDLYSIFDPIGGLTLGASNYSFAISEIITSMAGFFIGDGVVSIVSEQLENLVSSDEYKAFAEIARGIFPIFVICVLVFIAISASKVVRARESILRVVTLSAGVMISISLLWVAIDSPQPLITISKNIITFGESLQSAAINEVSKDDEIVESSDLDNVLTASLWRKSVFEPWVSAVFCGAKYEDLYTSYSDTGNKWEEDEDVSKKYGDISVYRDNNPENDVKNWAALAYSCSSIYHIDAVRNEGDIPSKDEKYSDDAAKDWPKATRVGSSEYVYSDDFRWIDAFSKVGKFEEGASGKSDPYIEANFKISDPMNMFAMSQRSVYLAILLVPIIIVGIRKTICSIQAIMNFFILMYRSCMNIISPGDSEYSLISNIKAMYTPLVLYFWYIVISTICITLYNIIASAANPILDIIYLVIAFYLGFNKPKNIKDHAEGSFKWLNGKALAFKSYVNRGVGFHREWTGEIRSAVRSSDDNPVKNTRDLIKKASTRLGGTNSQPYDAPYEESNGNESALESFVDSRGLRETISPSIYLEADLRKMPNHIRSRYIALINKIKSCRTNSEVWLAINLHRFSKSFDGGSSDDLYSTNTKNVYYDSKYLDITPNQSADCSLNGDKRYNKYYNVEASNAYNMYKTQANIRNNDLQRRSDEIRDRIKAKNMVNDGKLKYDSIGNVVDDNNLIGDVKCKLNKRNLDEKRINKDIKKLARDKKLALVQNGIEGFTHQSMLLSVKTILFITGFIILVYNVGLVLSALFG